MHTDEGDNLRLRRLHRDKTERVYRQESGVFAPPSWSPTLPVATKAADKDKLLSDLRSQRGVTGLAVTPGLVLMDSSLREALAAAEQCSPSAAEAVKD